MLGISLPTRRQLVETGGDEFAGAIRQRLGSFVDLDAGDAAGLFDQFYQRGPVPGFLPDGLVIENDAGDVFRQRLGAKQHLAIVAAGVFGGFDLDRVKPLLDGTGRFVGGEKSLAGRDHGLGHLVEVEKIHRYLPVVAVRLAEYQQNYGLA
jgi:hypothetical protein